MSQVLSDPINITPSQSRLSTEHEITFHSIRYILLYSIALIPVVISD